MNFSVDPEAQRAAAGALAELVGRGSVGGILVERLDGVSVLDTATNSQRGDTVDSLIAAGFARTPRGLRMR